MNISLYVLLLKNEVRKTFHNLLLLLNTFEMVIILFVKISLNLFIQDLPSLGPQSILSASLQTKLHNPKAQHALHTCCGPCRDGQKNSMKLHFTELNVKRITTTVLKAAVSKFLSWTSSKTNYKRKFTIQVGSLYTTLVLTVERFVSVVYPFKKFL